MTEVKVDSGVVNVLQRVSPTLNNLGCYSETGLQAELFAEITPVGRSYLRRIV